MILQGVVDGHEAFRRRGTVGGPVECDVVVAAFLPIRHLRAVDGVVEADHASDRRPTLLAVPVAVGHLRRILRSGACLVHAHVWHLGVGRVLHAIVVLRGFVEVVVGQNLRMPVVVTEHERVRELIAGAGRGAQRFGAAGAVPVRYEHCGVVGAFQ